MFKNILGFIIDQSIRETNLAKIVSGILGTAIAFAVYYLVGLASGGLAHGFMWVVVVGGVLTLLQGLAKIRYIPKSSRFHEWVMAAAAVAVAGAIYLIPTVWMVVALHTVYVVISIWSAKIALKQTDISLGLSGLGLDK